MVPEPEPGPRDDALERQAPDYGHPTGEPVPPGLVYVNGVLRSDPATLPDLVLERNPQWTERLAADPRLPAIVDGLLAQSAVRDTIVAVLDSATDPEARDVARHSLWRILHVGADLLDAPGVARGARIAFLGRAVLQELFARYGAAESLPDYVPALFGFGPLEPVLLLALPPWAPMGQPLAIYPGDIVLIFRAASWTERESYDTLIAEIQKWFGYTRATGAKERGGRRRIGDDPVKADQARTAAQLAWMGLTGPEIAGALGWVQPGDTGREKKYAKRADDYVAAGIELTPPGTPEWEATRRLSPVRRPTRPSVLAWMDPKEPPEG